MVGRALLPALIAAGLIMLAATVRAEPLAKEACDVIKAEHEALGSGGVKEDMAKGPEWAKANLAADKLKRIETFIGLEEQLNFRCGLARIRFVLPAEEEAPAAAPASEPPLAAKPKPKPKPATKPAAAKAAEPNASEPKAAAAAEPETVPKSKSKPKSKPKPTQDDAYRPPASANPAADPFAKPGSAPKG